MNVLGNVNKYFFEIYFIFNLIEKWDIRFSVMVLTPKTFAKGGVTSRTASCCKINKILYMASNVFDNIYNKLQTYANNVNPKRSWN